jgi:hypothetical protein
MFKKMLKGMLAVAMVCGMSSAAFAGTDTSAWIQAQISSNTGTLTNKYYGKVEVMNKGEKVKGDFDFSFNNSATPGVGSAYVMYSMNDMIDLAIGRYSDGATWGISKGSWAMGASYNPTGNSKITSAWIFWTEGIHANIKLSDSLRIATGAKNSSGTLDPYLHVIGNAGSLKYQVGYLTNGGTTASVKMDLSDSILLQGDIGMPSAGGTGIGINARIKDLGPGELSASMSSAGSDSGMGVNYQIVLEPGKFLDIYYNSSSGSTVGSDVGISMMALF